MPKKKTKQKPEYEALGWRITRKRLRFNCPWYQVREDTVLLPDGKRIAYAHVHHPGSVFIVPFTKDGRIILIRSYRYSIDKWCWEVPAGSLADAEGARPQAVARRELAEEIGAVAENLELIGTQFLCNGVGNIQGWFFLAQNVEFCKRRELNPIEVIKDVTAMPIEQARRLILQGDFGDGDSALAIFLAIEYMRQR